MIRSLETRRGPADAGRARLFTPAFVMVALASLAYFTADGILIAAVPRFVEGPLGGGDVAVGFAVGAFSLSAFFLRPLAGRWGDRHGRRLLMMLGATAFAVSVLGYPLAASPAALVPLRLLTGAGEALFFVGALSAVADLAPRSRRGEAMSFASLSLYVGIGVGPLLGEAALERWAFSGAWLLAALVAAVAVALSMRMPDTRPGAVTAPPPMRDAGPAPAAPPAVAHRLVHPAGLLPGVVMLASIWGMAGFLTFVPLYAPGVGVRASIVLALFSGIVVGIRSIGARIPDRLGAGRSVRVALLASSAGLLVIGARPTAAGLVVGTAVFATGIALFTPALMTLAVEAVPPAERGAVIGTTSAFLDLALGLGPATLGFVAATAGRAGTFLAGSAVALGGLVLVMRSGFGRARRRQAAPIPPLPDGETRRGEAARGAP